MIGPSVSFVALVALLRTIVLQRDALAMQREQFSKMMSAQDEVLVSQTKQLRLAEQAAAADKMNAYKASVLNYIEQQMGHYRITIERIDARLIALVPGTMQNVGAQKAIEPTCNGLNQKMKQAETQLNKLLGAASLFILKQHHSIEEIKSDFRTDFMPSRYTQLLEHK